MSELEHKVWLFTLIATVSWGIILLILSAV